MTLEDLKSMIAGSVVAAEDPTHAEAVAALQWNARKQGRQPALIVRAASVADVQAAVRYADANGLRVSPRGAGHNLSGIAMQDGIVIDLAALSNVHVDAAARIAEVGPAVTNGALADILTAEGLAFPLGHCASVPMSGYLLGGGLGWNSGTWGFACSRVESVDIVLPDGSFCRASATQAPDLFWAARGAGPEFFGVVVGCRLKLELLPAAMMSGARIYPLSRVTELEAWMDAVLEAFPENVDVAVEMRNVPHPALEQTVSVAVAICVVYGADAAQAEAIHGVIARLAPSEPLDEIGPMPTSFAALYAQTGGSMPQGHRYAIDSFWADERAGDMVAALAHAISAAPSLHCHSLVARYPSGRPAMPDAAFSMAAPVWASLCAGWDTAAEDAAHLSWLRGAADTVGTAALGHYVGESDLERPGRLARCYAPAVLAKLRTLQARHDPKGLFLRGVAARGTSSMARVA